jgi:methionyl-tRNA formyltransferase
MGTAAFAVPSLERLLAAPWADVVGVITQPPRPAGRGRDLHLSPVHQRASEAGLTVFTPERLRRPPAVAQLRAWQPDLCIVAAYGQLLSAEVLATPPHGCLNVHGSLLPHHRGAAPVAGALLAGDDVTGVTIMLMDAGLDTGPLLSTVTVPIAPDDTTGSLTERLAHAGADLLVRTAHAWLAGQITPQPQDEAQATLTRPLRKEEGEIDWTQPAITIERRIRAFQPWPTAYTVDEAGARIVLLAARVHAEPRDILPGLLWRDGARALIGTGHGALEPERVQPAGRRPMAFADYLRGRRGSTGDIRFGSATAGDAGILT